MATNNWSRVFRNIWRINAVAILLLLVISVIGLSASILPELFHSSKTKETQAPNVAPSETGKPELRLGGFVGVRSTSVVRAELHELGQGGSFSYKGGSQTPHNILFFDTKDGKSWWLLPNSNSTIDSEHPISLPDDGVETPIAMVYRVVDSNPNQSLKSIILSDPKGTKTLILASGDCEIDEVFTSNRSEAKILYHASNGYHLITVNPTETIKISEIPISFTFPPQK